MLQVENLSKHYGSIESVSELSFALADREIIGLLGENGAGKSTTMNMLTGCLPQTSGTIAFKGVDTAEDPLLYKSRIGYLPEIPPLYLDMTVIEQLEFVCAVKGISRSELSAEVERVCRLTNITHMGRRLTRNLSKGYKQRVGLAQALIASPDFLVLDEPMAGLDPRQISEMRELIISLGMTVIISSHILSEISAMCSRLLVLKKGRLIADSGTADFIRLYGGEGIIHLRFRGEECREAACAVFSGLAGISRWQEVAAAEEGCIEYMVFPAGKEDIRESLYALLSASRLPLLHFELRKPALEDIFIELTA